MAKSKSGRVDEDLRGENRNLRKEIKHLRRELDRLSKSLNKSENMMDNFTYHIDEVLEETVVVQTRATCKECGKGPIKVIDLSIRKLLVCQECGHREVHK